MWKIENPEIRKSTLDFTSSEQGFFEVSQLIYENVVLMNAIELMDFDDDAVQLIICEHCGTVNCSLGNWVCFRKSGNLILLIPDFEGIKQDNWSANEFSPPNYYEKNNHNKRKGMPYFEAKTYENLRRSFSEFPKLENIKDLKMSEAMRLAQFNMPFQFFGKPPEIIIQPNKLTLAVAASEGEISQHLNKIEHILQSNYENDSTALIRKPSGNEEIIYLFLDADEFFDWQALVKSGENYLLMLDEEFVIE